MTKEQILEVFPPYLPKPFHEGYSKDELTLLERGYEYAVGVLIATLDRVVTSPLPTTKEVR